MMTSAEIRQSFLDFFKSKQHTIVPSASLMPDSPNLLFTNAGMNQFVPIFLGERKPDVDQWAGADPGLPTRAADTQKCIRAGGKHNDLEDVGLDTYHHTFFEMLGNWSFGDYFKKEAIEWAWELLTDVWKFPKERLYATIYRPGEGDPAEFDQEAYDIWKNIFRKSGLDPYVHIIYGNKKDNFWMMGETGPCGPCAEIHMDLTPDGETRGALVNKDSSDCIEIWNLVFIQFNANPDGSFSPLPSRHVDTGMGFERVASVIQTTKNFTDFKNAKISNYETDIFRPIFDALEKLSGKKYGSTLPGEALVPSRLANDAPAVGSGEHTRPRVSQSAPSPIAREASGATETKYSRRNLPHFERPWAKYMVTFSARERRELTASERDLVMKSILYAREHRQYELYAACVMPDHVHLLFEPQIKEEDKEGNPVFWSVNEILQGIKSASAHHINKASGEKGSVWEKESMDRMIRGQSDMEEKFHYICRNPWDSGVVLRTESYPWLWTPEVAAWTEGGGNSGEHTRPRVFQSAPSPIRSHHAEDAVGEAPTAAREGACAPPEAAAPLHQSEQEQIDVAFRVIADHIRTLTFSIADGIQPANTDRNYVLRRILRRAVRYGRTLGFHEPFFFKLVDVLVETMGEVFPEIRAKKDHIKEVIQREEEAFNKTLDTGISLFNEFARDTDLPKESAQEAKGLIQSALVLVEKTSQNENFDDISSVNLLLETTKQLLKSVSPLLGGWENQLRNSFNEVERLVAATERILEEEYPSNALLADWKSNLSELDARLEEIHSEQPTISGRMAFMLYDTYGFPLDLTELMARERGLTVDVEGFNKLMEEQRERARAAQKKEVIQVIDVVADFKPTHFVGYDSLEIETKPIVETAGSNLLMTDKTPFYAEMGGQVSDTGTIELLDRCGNIEPRKYRVVGVAKSAAGVYLHKIEGDRQVRYRADRQSTDTDVRAKMKVDRPRREAIQRHHTVTHLFHWALHEVVSQEAHQQGSYVGPEKLTFDFNSAPLTPRQIADIEKLVNERILENAAVSWIEVPYSEIRDRKDVLQFFGDKYGDVVRVVQIGGRAGELNGYSMELCGGTHTRATGEIGLFRIVGESAIAAGIRRVEAVAGLEAYEQASRQIELIKSIAGKVNSPVTELEKKIESLLARQKELEKALKAAKQREAAQSAKSLIASAETINGVPLITKNLGEVDGDTVQTVADALKGEFQGVVVLGGVNNGAVALVATVSPDLTKRIQAGKLIQQIAPIVGGKGGGRPDNARGGGKDTTKLDEALAKAGAIL